MAAVDTAAISNRHDSNRINKNAYDILISNIPLTALLPSAYTLSPDTDK
jgi:hypothetical protein